MNKIEIDLDALVAKAVPYMDAENDLRWSIGMALQEMFPEQVGALQLRMVRAYKALNDAEVEA